MARTFCYFSSSSVGFYEAVYDEDKALQVHGQVVKA